MYNECYSPISRHKITLDGLTCHKNQSFNRGWNDKMDDLKKTTLQIF